MSLSAFDLDGTLLLKNSSFAFCHYLYKSGFLKASDFYFCVFCYFKHKKCGASLSWLHTVVFERLFKGRSVSSLLPHIETFLDKSLSKLQYLPAIQRLKQCLDADCEVAILSNSPIFIVQAIATRLQVKKVMATDYHIDSHGVLSSIATIVDGSHKAGFLASSPHPIKEAYTDSILDLPFLRAATKKIVVRPDKELKKLAIASGWERL